MLAPWVADEVKSAELNDKRLNRRLAEVLSLLGAVSLGYTDVTVNGYALNFFDGIGVEAIMVVGAVGVVLLLGVLALMMTIFRRDT